MQKNHEEILQQMLPSNYEHKIVSVDPMQIYHKLSALDQSEMFAALVRVNLRSKEEACQWFEDFKQSSFTDWRTRRCFEENSRCRIYKKGYRCHFDTAKKKGKPNPDQKHIACRASLCITVLNPNMQRSKDKLLKDFPCEITLHHCHNHSIMSCDVLRHRKPTPRVTREFLEMYARGHSPSSALAALKYDIQVKHPESWFERLSDGSECPNLQWCYHVYRKNFPKEYGAPLSAAMVQSLLTAIHKYNAECGSECAKAEIFRNSDLIVAMCSPFMKRVHQLLSTSGEINFLVSGGMTKGYNARIFTILAPSVAGALPLGIIFTSSESPPVLSHAMTMLQSIMPPDAFCGRGPAQGPQIMMSDDTLEDRNFLSSCFPEIVLLLRLFHILQAFWRYLWDSKHKVHAKDVEEIYLFFLQWCYSESEEEFQKRYNDMLYHPMIAQNPILVKQIKSLFERAGEWAPYYDLTRGNNINDFSERTILWYKNEILERLRAYNVVQLFDFVSTRLDAFFERQIAAVLNDQKENYWSSMNFIVPSKLEPLQCSIASHEETYLVKNVEKGTEYIVNMNVQVCSCIVGKNGLPCKHQFAVAQQFQLSTVHFLPYADEEAKSILHQIITSMPAKPGLYAPYVPLNSPLQTDMKCDSTEEIITLNNPPQIVISSSPSEEIMTLNSPPQTPADIKSKPSVNTGEIIILEGVPLEAGSQYYYIDLPDDDNSSNASVQDSLPSTSEVDSLKDQALELWQSVNDYIITGLQERPAMFSGPVLQFASKFIDSKGLSDDSALSALLNFSIVGDNAVQSDRHIKLNAAAKIKRKYRKRNRSTDPLKLELTDEHDYCASKKSFLFC